MDDFTIKLWNFDKVSFIDEEKTKFKIEKGIYKCDLYLKEHIKVCPYCFMNNIYIKSKDTIFIKHALKNKEYSEIDFHKRKYKCNSCGHNFYEDINDLKIIKNTDYYYRNSILLDLKDASLTYKKIANKYNTTTTNIMYLFDRNVDIKRHKLSDVLSIDEIYSKRLTKTKYCCILYDPLGDTIIDVLDSRRKDALKEYFYNISKEERDNVKYFTSDLNETYRSIHNTFFKESIHAVDSFHVIKNLNDRFNSLRIRIMKESENDKNINDFDYWLLKKFSWMFLTGIDKIKKDKYYFRKRNMELDKYQVFEYMSKISPELRRAYDLKEEYRNFNLYYKYDEAKEKLDELINEFLLSDSPEMQSFGLLLNNWYIEILNSFIRIKNNFRLSNARLENTNRAIKLLFSISYGYSNFPRTRNRIMYSFNTGEDVLNFLKKFDNRRKGKPRGKYNKR